MTKTLAQARGSATDLVLAFEPQFGVAAQTGGTRLAFNSSGVSASRDLNTAETIQPGRSPIEPFQGNGSVEGDMVLPLDLDQIGVMLRAAFGAPETTAPADAKDISAVADNSSALPGTVKFTLPSGHGYTAGDKFVVYGSTNYNGQYQVLSVSGNDIVVKHGYAAESIAAKATKTGFTHVFRIKDDQPSFTLEQLHKDVAEHFVYRGCKVSTLAFGAETDGQEATYTVGILGAAPLGAGAPGVITAASSGGGKLTLTTQTNGLVNGDEVVIAGIDGVSGRHVVSNVSASTFSIASSAAAPTITSGNEPVWRKAQIKEPRDIAIRRLGTFSARLRKDGQEYKCAKSFTLNIDLGLDGDQRLIGDDGYRSSIPEGTVSLDATLTALFRDGDLFRHGALNETIGLELVYTLASGIGSLSFDMPENKVQETSPAVDTPRGLSQEISVMAFSSDISRSALTVKLINGIESY